MTQSLRHSVIASDAAGPVREPESRSRYDVQVGTRLLFSIAYVFLALVLAGAVAVAAVTSLHDVRVQTKTETVTQVVRDVATAKRVLGQPTQTVPGDQIGQPLAGATCDVYSYGDGAALLCHS